MGGGSAAAVTGGLVERDGVLDQLTAALDRASSGAGELVVIDAAGGLGKTTLLAALVALLAAGPHRVLSACGYEQERAFAFGVVRQLLERPLADRGTRRSVLVDAAEVVSIMFAGAGPPDAEIAPMQARHGLYWAIANLAQRETLVVIVDDAHEADDASLQFLAYLSRRLADLPVLLVVATRPAPEAGGRPELADLRSAGTRLELLPLSEQAVATLVTREVGASCAPEFARACHSVTGGNPFYLTELIKDVGRQGIAPDAANAGRVAQLSPPVIVGSVLMRLASLAEGGISLARACAVLGDGAELRECAALAELAAAAAATAADALTKAGIFGATPQLCFAHPILRAAVLADIGEHSRRHWHARAAQILEAAGYGAEVVAQHLLNAPTRGDLHVRDVLARAGLTAARDGSPATAARLLRRARAESTAPPGADLLYELGRVEAALGSEEGLQLMASGAVSTVDPAERVRRALRLANLQMRTGDLPEAVHLLREVRVGVQDDDELLLSVDATCYWAGRLHPETREQAMRDAIALRSRVDGPDTPARRMLHAFLACEAAQSESADVAAAMFDRALAPPGLLAFVPFDSVAVQASMFSLAALERQADFDALSDEVLGAAGQRGALLAFLVAATFRAMAMLRRGNLAGAEAEAREALRSAAEQGWTPGAASLAALRAAALLDQGDLSGADSALADAERMHVAPGFPAALLLSAKGRLAAAHGDRAAAVTHLLDCGRTLATMQVHSPGVLPWRSDASAVLTEAGDLDQARELATAELELARRLAGPTAVAAALRALARTSPRAERIELLVEARSLLAPSPGTLVQAAVAADLGAMLRRTGRATEARGHLAAALDAAAACGAAPLARRAREELLAAGGRPRRARQRGPDALTASEVRVARLAAAGATNTVIAQTLFVSRKTVEKHLANAYRKLGVESRAELDPAVLEPHSNW